MSLVENEHIKMEWEQSEWIQTKKGNFIAAGKVYENSDGEQVTVMFTPFHASIIETEEGSMKAMTVSEIKKLIKSYNDTAYPDYDEGFIALCDYEGIDEQIIKDLKLEGNEEDIEARVKDLSYFGEEREYTG